MDSTVLGLTVLGGDTRVRTNGQLIRLDQLSGSTGPAGPQGEQGETGPRVRQVLKVPKVLQAQLVQQVQQVQQVLRELQVQLAKTEPTGPLIRQISITNSRSITSNRWISCC